MPKSRYTEQKKPKPEKITIEGFQKYLNENGADKAQGYIDAMTLMNENIEALFSCYDSKRGFERTTSPNRLRTSLYSFVDEMHKVLGEIKNIPSAKAQSNDIS